MQIEGTTAGKRSAKFAVWGGSDQLLRNSLKTFWKVREPSITFLKMLLDEATLGSLRAQSAFEI